MTIRRTIMLLGIPPFLLLALANAALFYWQEKSELETGLRNQALAAAVTTAEFARQRRNGAGLLASPARTSAIRQAAATVPDLAALQLVSGGAVLTLYGRSPVNIRAHRRPDHPLVFDADAQGLVTAIAPAGPGSFVVASIDAAALASRLDRLLIEILVLALGAVAVGTLLSALVARGLSRALQRTSRLIDAVHAGGQPSSDRRETIQEIREFGEAVVLIGANLQAVRQRLDSVLQTHRPDAAEAVAAFRGQWLAPLEATDAGVTVSASLIGDAAPGCFFLLHQKANGAVLFLGECAGEDPVSALANAVAARAFIDAELVRSEPAAVVDRARDGYQLARCNWFAWTEADAGLLVGSGVRALTLLAPEDEARAAAYAERLPTLGARELVGDLLLLLPPSAGGIVAALRPA